MKGYQTEHAQTGAADHVSQDDKEPYKGDTYSTNVLPVSDLETGGSPHQGEVIPDGVDPELMRVEQVHRGLKQRHIQVRHFIGPSLKW